MPTISVTAELKALNGSCIQHEQITSNDQLVGFVDSTNSQDWGLEYWNGVRVLEWGLGIGLGSGCWTGVWSIGLGSGYHQQLGG